MGTKIDVVDLAGVVRAAQQGDEAAWEDLVGRFQDRAVAMALGLSGCWDMAGDVVQDAFRLAYLHLGELREPVAFPAWFARLTRTACARARRTARPHQLASAAGAPLCVSPLDPAEEVVEKEEAARVRSAIEQLPGQERTVVALFYLAEMSLAEIAEFLGIGLSAAKKRAVTARRHLKELMPMAEEALAAARPSRTDALRATVLLFSAIHRQDAETVTRLVAAQPSLARAIEDWTPEEAASASIGYAGHATALIRAAETGQVDLARVLIDAGAPVDDRCGCPGGETPLWAASVAGKADMVSFLLQAGAEPNTSAFRGATPLHTAIQRGRHEVARLLLAAGADPGRPDDGGRRPADWGRLSSPRPSASRGEFVWTGVRAVDLFSPIRRGSLQWWPAAVGLGQYVVVAAVSAALADDVWYLGFDQPHVDAASIRHGLEETALGGHVDLAPRHLRPPERRRLFTRALERLSRAPAKARVVVCLVDAGHRHDVEVALPGFRSDPTVLTTIVVEPFLGAYPQPGLEPPESYDQQVSFDPRRVRSGLYPAIHHATSVSRSWPSDRHRDLANEVRRRLSAYDLVDPELSLPDPATIPVPEARIAQGLLRYLAHAFTIGEPFTSVPGEVAAYPQLLDDVERLLGGR
ncbi:MAG: sigma-70 family RNA polymerase sigma factor [Acidimicrobiales bacterium]|nr:sigma-70 family RNA polymerase sigma factor [Acidimicrobiales bacterium]